MKVTDTVKNYESERRMYTNFVIRNIKKICKEIGPRISGSQQELEAQQRMADEMKSCCDEVKIEDFKVSPWAFMGFLPVAIFFTSVSAILLFVSQLLPRLDINISFGYVLNIISVAFVIIAVAIMIVEFLLYKECLDPFFKKATSHNVIAVRKASGETKRRIIFSGHSDSAPECRFTYWGGSKLVVSVAISALLGLAVTIIFSIIALVFDLKGTENSTLLWVFSIVDLCFVPIIIATNLFYDKKHPVEGANDDLSGCYLSMMVPRYLQDHDIRFENTEVMVVCTGSEESGLRGAKAFCKAHADEIKNEDIETVYFGIDTVRDFDYMCIYNKDMTGTVHNSEEVVKLIREGGKLAGYDLPSSVVSVGSTDAAAITQAGLKGACFGAMDPAPARYYHTRLDTHDNMDMKTIEAAVDICLQTTFLFDEKGLNV